MVYELELVLQVDKHKIFKNIPVDSCEAYLSTRLSRKKMIKIN